MYGTTAHADIRVSIQNRNAPDRAAGHLAAAVLVDGDTVLVPNPGPELLDPSAELEILIFPADPKAHLPIEIIPVWKRSPFHLTGARGAAGGHRQACATTPATAPRSARWTPASWPQLWQSTAGTCGRRSTGCPRCRPGSPTSAANCWPRSSRVEREQRRPRRSEHEFDSYEQLVSGFCIFFCFCNPHGPK